MTTSRFSRWTAMTAVLGALAVGGPARAEPTSPAPPARTDAEAYCSGIVDAAAEARFAWQASTLKTLEDKLSETLAKLEERKAEVAALMAARDAEVQRAEARMVEIFQRMRPDAAAQQLAAMDQSTAASLLGKLAPRAASAVLNEMEAARAAQLAEAIGGRRPSPAPATRN